ncbi:MAG: FAD-dependent oxidoreductase, partial [Candidatus Competibacterales bacterium]|nr:FAD-dependent oxidoreductase [Candidatus Competibacterales bacterium]
MADYDYAVVGGGMVGAAIAYGLTRRVAQRGRRVVLLDEGDRALRAARGNFGLVWVQSKGLNCPPYAHWTRDSADLWPDFERELR